ncbi:hypothetical protein EWR22_25265 [Mycolicibacterium monacense DSM 44395]|nr:hypothetical protein EWR22_25265 [Mycolicibacterium monacense DSM 44395]
MVPAVARWWPARGYRYPGRWPRRRVGAWPARRRSARRPGSTEPRPVVGRVPPGKSCWCGLR